MLVSHLLQQLVRVGRLRVVDANGKVHEFSGADGPSCAIRLHDRALHSKLFLNPELYVGE